MILFTMLYGLVQLLCLDRSVLVDLDKTKIRNRKDFILKFHQNIPFGSRDKASFTFSEFGHRLQPDRQNMIYLP